VRPDVHPYAAEIIGDDVDTDCDGVLDLGRRPLFQSKHTNLEGWAWNAELNGMGGAVMTESNFLGSHNIWFPDSVEAVPAVVYETYMLVQSPTVTAPTVRLWPDTGPVDVVSITDDGAQALLAWSGAELLYLDLRAGAGAKTIDGWVSPAGILHIAACGNGQLTWLQGDVNTGEVVADHTIEDDADTCVLLAPDGEVMMLAGYSTTSGPLTRWRLDTTDGFGDYLQLNPSVRIDRFDSANEGDDAIFAMAMDKEVLVFSGNGQGDTFEVEDPVVRLGVDVNGVGDGVVAITDAGHLHVRVGPVADTFTEIGVYPLSDPATTLLAGINPAGDVAVAAADVALWEVVRGFAE
jgi:hypothetical protein